MADTRQVVERSVEVWNSHDRNGWLQLGHDDIGLMAPGDFVAKGQDAWGQFYDIWQDAFPGCRVQTRVIAGDDEIGTLEAVFTGTHSGVLRPPSGPEIPPTQKQVNVNFVVVQRVAGGKFASFHLYFDQVQLLTQLGLMPAPTAPGT